MQPTDSEYHSEDLLSHSHCHPGCHSWTREWRDCALFACLCWHPWPLYPHLHVNSRSCSTRPQIYLHTRWHYCADEEKLKLQPRLRHLLSMVQRRFSTSGAASNESLMAFREEHMSALVTYTILQTEKDQEWMYEDVKEQQKAYVQWNLLTQGR